ncbi:MAG: hypothetical protein NTU41_06415 [Chloroflexi bacterium]|nr:hypothetical protein [Chloroflexota bacterium]
MKKFSGFWMRAIRRAVKTLYFWVGVMFTVVSLVPFSVPATWYGDWGRWLVFSIGLLLMVLWSPYEVWKETDNERENLQQRLNKFEADRKSLNSDVKLQEFDPELQYEVNRNGNRLIEIILHGRLVNNSVTNSGRLRWLVIEIPVETGQLVTTFRAEVEQPPINYLFEPGSICPLAYFCFRGKLSDEAHDIQSWEPYIRGAKGKILLDVFPQEMRTYSIKIADEGKIH